MPNSIIKSLSKKSGKPIEEVEKLWDKAISITKKKGLGEHSDQFTAYVLGVMKKMLSINETYDDLNSKHRLRQKPKQSMSKIFKRDEYLRRKADDDKKRKKNRMSKVDKKLKDIEESIKLK